MANSKVCFIRNNIGQVGHVNHAGRILILDITIDGTDYILINIYNATSNTEQI